MRKGEIVHAGNLIDIDTARTLVASTKRRPWQGDQTVVHLTAAHLVRGDVWNTLLKVLEEPPPYVQVHLYAPSTDSIPRTIRSRSHVTRESVPHVIPEDASRLVRLYESGDALSMLREADRHTNQAEALQAVESLWIYATETKKLEAMQLAEYYLTMLRRGATPRIVMKALLIQLAVRHRVAKSE